MKYTECDHWDELSSEIHISISFSEMVNVSLDNFDRVLLAKCNKSNSIADKLLGLETIARMRRRRKIK